MFQVFISLLACIAIVIQTIMLISVYIDVYSVQFELSAPSLQIRLKSLRLSRSTKVPWLLMTLRSVENDKDLFHRILN